MGMNHSQDDVSRVTSRTPITLYDIKNCDTRRRLARSARIMLDAQVSQTKAPLNAAPPLL
jgi:hypothetical protein